MPYGYSVRPLSGDRLKNNSKLASVATDRQQDRNFATSMNSYTPYCHGIVLLRHLRQPSVTCINSPTTLFRMRCSHRKNRVTTSPSMPMRQFQTAKRPLHMPAQSVINRKKNWTYQHKPRKFHLQVTARKKHRSSPNDLYNNHEQTKHPTFRLHPD